MFKKILLSLVFLLSSNFNVVESAQSSDESAGLKKVFMSVEDVAQFALENNLDMQIAKFDAYAKRNDLLESVSVFDTILSLKAFHLDDQFKPPSTITGTKDVINSYAAGISKELPSGTVIGLDYSDDRENSNSSFATINPSHESIAKVSITQPIGKNFFGLEDRNGVKVTKKEIENSDLEALNRIENALAETLKAYWRVVLLTEELDIKQETLKKAKELYNVYAKKRWIGLTEDSDFFGSEANVAKREDEVLVAFEALKVAKYNLLLLLNEDSRSYDIEALNYLSLKDGSVSFEEALYRAILNRRDYQQAKNNIEIKKISLVTKTNELWPEIDVEASFAKNGLSRKYSDAGKEIFNQDNPEYYMGVSFKMPLENSEARGVFNKAKIERAKAIVELKKIEREIVTQINDLTTKIKLFMGSVIVNKRVAQLQQKKLDAEIQRFKYGRSNSDYLIRYQEDLLDARLNLARALYLYQATLIDLKVAQQILLDEYWRGAL